jgi:hypothetical protein
MNKYEHYEHYYVMFVIMIIAGMLSTMNVWVDKIDDIRISLNDVYMTLLMTGWMFLFMGIYYKETIIILIGFILVLLNLFFIRNQTFITNNQFRLGMIPHHSMAVHMSKKLLETNSKNIEFLQNIIKTQESEIEFMKKSFQ